MSPTVPGISVSCHVPGCSGFLQADGACDGKPSHGNRRARFDAQRSSARARGYDTRWAKGSKAYLIRYPLCASCKRGGRVTAATLTDHVVPHRGDRALFWDSTNWQPLCEDCHATKTARESGIQRCSHAPAVLFATRGIVCLDCGRILSAIGTPIPAAPATPGGGNSSRPSASGPREASDARADGIGRFTARAGNAGNGVPR